MYRGSEKCINLPEVTQLGREWHNWDLNPVFPYIILTLLPTHFRSPREKKRLHSRGEHRDYKTEDRRVEGILEYAECMYVCEVGRCRLGRCPGTKAFPAV